MKKKIISLSLISAMVCSTVSVCGMSFANASSTNESVYFQLGELERDYIDNDSKNENEDIAKKGKDFNISKSELDYYNKRHEIINSAESSKQNKTDNNASEYLIERETVYANALKNGITVSDKELKEYIQKQIDTFNSAEPDEGVQAFLDGLGMTWEEYWNSPTQIEILKKDLINSKYKNQLRESIAEDNGLDIEICDEYYLTEDGIASNGLDAKEYQKVENELEECIEDLVENESVK